MSFLLDTCVLSETVRPRPEPGVLKWLESQDEPRLFMSVLTLGEIHKGIAKLDDGPRKNELAEWVDQALTPRFGRRILPIDAAVASAWGRLTVQSERRGAPLPVIDGLLAATARVHDLSVVTRNVKHFGGIGISVIDPWARV